MNSLGFSKTADGKDKTKDDLNADLAEAKSAFKSSRAIAELVSTN